MPRRADTSSQQTRARLLDAATAVFVERGFANAPLEEITSRAGFTRGAFHWHFKSKHELLIAVLERRLSEAIAEADHVVATTGSPAAFNGAQRRRTPKRSLVERRAWGLLLMEFWLLAARDPTLAGAAAELKEQLRQATIRQIEQLTGNTKLPLPTRTIASALMALDDGFALQELLEPGGTKDMLWDVVDYITATLLPNE